MRLIYGDVIIYSTSLYYIRTIHYVSFYKLKINLLHNKYLHISENGYEPILMLFRVSL